MSLLALVWLNLKSRWLAFQQRDELLAEQMRRVWKR